MAAFEESLVGRHVTIVSGVGGDSEHTDTGTLVLVNDGWVQLAKDNGEVLLFPHTALRAIKLLDVEPSYTVTKQELR
jgi:hypothetical protein